MVLNKTVLGKTMFDKTVLYKTVVDKTILDTMCTTTGSDTTRQTMRQKGQTRHDNRQDKIRHNKASDKTLGGSIFARLACPGGWLAEAGQTEGFHFRPFGMSGRGFNNSSLN